MWRVRVSVSHPARHATPYRPELPSHSDQKLKLSEETRKIQLRHSFVSGFEAEYGSGGQMCRGCVRHVRGVYDSTNIRSEILWRAIRQPGQRSKADTHIFSSSLYPVITDLHDVRFLARSLDIMSQKCKRRPTASAYSQLGTTRLTTRARIIRCICSITCVLHNCLYCTGGSMGIATDNIFESD